MARGLWSVVRGLLSVETKGRLPGLVPRYLDLLPAISRRMSVETDLGDNLFENDPADSPGKTQRGNLGMMSAKLAVFTTASAVSSNSVDDELKAIRKPAKENMPRSPWLSPMAMTS